MGSSTDLKYVRTFFPKLSSALTKGDCGRIGVIGGYREYTGAPFFVAMTAVRMGADLAYIFASLDVATAIKTYSPEVMVQPSQNFDDIRERLVCLHVLVFGPGLGRDTERTKPILLKIFDLLQETPHLGLVIDADGLYLIASSDECLSKLRDLKDQVLLTPNAREFQKLYERTPLIEDMDDLPNDERVRRLAEYLNVCVLRKDDVDVISDGKQVRYGSVPGSLRRCGGQGDVISGSAAMFAYWAKWRDAGTPTPPGTTPFNSKHFLDAAEAASDFVRATATRAFARVGRPMTAMDIIAEIPKVVRDEIDGSNS